MGNLEIVCIFKGTPDVTTKLASIFNDDEAFAAFKVELDKHPEKKA